ncbi:hypothetical protein TrST_g7017 [Triparma strigata]|uniref:Uncharacterized protein n=1 Tax=Triparma strigata TaxID=1606541 RepID=A0A9W7EBS8_9STRA|nr:hypothetical protein TrST_g7017 [Triparma strigata]
MSTLPQSSLPIPAPLLPNFSMSSPTNSRPTTPSEQLKTAYSPSIPSNIRRRRANSSASPLPSSLPSPPSPPPLLPLPTTSYTCPTPPPFLSPPSPPSPQKEFPPSTPPRNVGLKLKTSNEKTDWNDPTKLTKVIPKQNLKTENKRVSPSYSMFTPPLLPLPSYDYTPLLPNLLLGSLESAFQQEWTSDTETCTGEEESKLSFHVLTHHSVRNLIILTSTFSPPLLTRIKASLPSVTVTYLSTSSPNYLPKASTYITSDVTMLVCSTGDRESAALTSYHLSSSKSGTQREWIEWCERLRPSVDVEWWERVHGNKRKDSISDDESPKRPKKTFDSVVMEEEDYNREGRESPTPLLTPPPKGIELEWPCGLTVDCGLMSANNLDREVVRTGLTPMLQGLGGEVDGEFAL